MSLLHNELYVFLFSVYFLQFYPNFLLKIFGNNINNLLHSNNLFTLPLSLPHTSCSYLRLCKEWLDLRPAATAAAPLSSMVFFSRLHYIIQTDTHIRTYVLMTRLDMNHMFTYMDTC